MGFNEGRSVAGWSGNRQMVPWYIRLWVLLKWDVLLVRLKFTEKNIQ